MIHSPYLAAFESFIPDFLDLLDHLRLSQPLMEYFESQLEFNQFLATAIG